MPSGAPGCCAHGSAPRVGSEDASPGSRRAGDVDLQGVGAGDNKAATQVVPIPSLPPAGGSRLGGRWAKHMGTRVGQRAALPGSRGALLGGRKAAKALYTVRPKLRAPSVPPCFFVFVCLLAISCRTSTSDLYSTTPVLFSTLFISRFNLKMVII